MQALLLLALAALLSAWAQIRYWTRLERESPALRPELNLKLARWPALAVLLAAVGATTLPSALAPGRASPDPVAALLLDFAPLTVVALFLVAGLAGLPIRRRVLGETWGPWAFLRERLALLLGFVAGLLVLAFLPAIALAMETPWRWVLAPLAAGAATLWLWRQGAILAWALGAGPIEDPEQRAACAACLDSPSLRLDGRRVGIAAVGDPSGGLVNALAVSGLSECRIFFSRRLLALLDPAETAAVCAHELAHLEWRNRSWLWRFRGAWLVLTGVGLALPALLPDPPWWMLPAWMAILILALVLLQGRQRGEEAACDARALELGARPEALASSLAKLYRSTLVPRRLAAAADRAATHPSLARRLQAIRQLAGLPGDDSHTPLEIASGAGRLRLDAEGVQYHAESAPGPDAQPTWRKPFASLIELYLTPSAKGATLTLGETEGKQTRVSLARADLPAVQDHLDRVDHRLAPLPQGSAADLRLAPFVALAILVGIYLHPAHPFTLFQQLLLLVPAVEAVLSRPGAALAILSALALGLATQTALDYGVPDLPSLASLLALGGAGLAGLALVRQGQTRVRPGPAVALAALCLSVGVYAWLDAGMRPWDPDLAIRLHGMGGERASLLLPLLALAAVLALAGRTARRSGAALGLVALLAMVATAPGPYSAWMPATGLDPLAATLPPPPAPSGSATFDELPLPGRAFGLQVAPTGERFLAMLVNPEGDGSLRWIFGTFAGPPTEIAAEQALLYEGGLLVVRRRADHAELTLLDEWGADGGAWTVRLPAIPADRSIALEASDGRWSLQEWDETSEEPVADYSGRIGDTGWQGALPDREESDPSPGTCATDRPGTLYASDTAPWTLRVETDAAALTGARRLWQPGLLRGEPPVSRLVLTGPDGQRQVFTTTGFVHCLLPVQSEQRLCLARSTRGADRILKVWSFDHRTGSFTPRLGTEEGLHTAPRADAGLLVVQTESEPARLVRIAPDRPASAFALPGGPLDEMQDLGDALFGLRHTAGASSLVRLTVPSGDPGSVAR